MKDKQSKESKQKKILHIDDEEIFRHECSQVFESTGFNVDFAANSIEGLDKIKKIRYDLILLDIIMPNLDNMQSENAGLELLTKIKETDTQLPVIMISVLKHMSKAIEALQLGAVDYITKDKIESEALIDKVREALRMVERSRDFIDYLICQGESATLEFKSSLRWNFKSDRIDSRIQLSWLKTLVGFLNSEGGILLVGVNNDGGIIGLDYDKFPSDDKLLLHISNMIRRHIGLEFSKFITYDLKVVEDKKVLFIECKKSREPVFLLIKEDEEDFYIRVGPSTQKLSTKRTFNYLQNKQK